MSSMKGYELISEVHKARGAWKTALDEPTLSDPVGRGTRMTREEATAVLEAHLSRTIDQEHLTMSEPEVWVYVDWATYLQHTVVQPSGGGPVQVHTITFKEVVERDAALYDHPLLDQIIEGTGLCPDCLYPLDECICPEDTGDDW